MIVFDSEEIKKDQVCFLHIPKTGGKTLWDLFGRQQETIHVWHSKFFKQLSQPEFLTMLRDPVDRVISTYYYIKRYERDPLYKQFRNMSLEQFVEYIKNDKIPNKRFKSKKDLRNLRYRTVNLATRYLSGGDPNNIKQAKNNIKRNISLVGFTDMYFESLFFMKKRFNWDLSAVKKQNQTKNRPKVNAIPKRLIKTIETYNQYDIELYRWAKAKFLKDIDALDSQTRNEMEVWVRDMQG
ncbi:sulfotransferase family 2 domain-containing protein [Tenuibacillus multivorans]|uniref:Galactose-3-O-sulfotransferase n=1 Tax=Tenuibacillus multivorans TaxID=237069 RepID=A0A1H0D003_9BACI|nr:sulfotransferase family 2 domain-containing protein [Tenuibacillus multivorans]GEL76099.1 hypothetical protein TMU01_03340 [Tenuibacillus multivorans]SDN63439.1 Galactose-3-O-sulfotransferase [Tenuibacillus multivorans]